MTNFSTQVATMSLMMMIKSLVISHSLDLEGALHRGETQKLDRFEAGSPAIT